MRRFFVLFITFILPLQVLEASFDDLAFAAVHPSQVHILQSVDSIDADQALPLIAAEQAGDKHPQASKNKPPPLHADLSDSVGSAALPAAIPYKPLAFAVPQPFWRSVPIIPGRKPPKFMHSPFA